MVVVLFEYVEKISDKSGESSPPRCSTLFARVRAYVKLRFLTTESTIIRHPTKCAPARKILPIRLIYIPLIIYLTVTFCLIAALCLAVYSDRSYRRNRKKAASCRVALTRATVIDALFTSHFIPSASRKTTRRLTSPLDFYEIFIGGNCSGRCRVSAPGLLHIVTTMYNETCFFIVFIPLDRQSHRARIIRAFALYTGISSHDSVMCKLRPRQAIDNFSIHARLINRQRSGAAAKTRAYVFFLFSNARGVARRDFRA